MKQIFFKKLIYMIPNKLNLYLGFNKIDESQEHDNPRVEFSQYSAILNHQV